MKMIPLFFVLALSIGFSLPFSSFGETEAKTDCGDRAHFPDLPKEELTRLIEAGSVTVVDVNSGSSFKKRHIPTAIHYGTNKKNFVQMLSADKSKLIVAYCGGPRCVAWHKAAKDACLAGYTNIKHFKAGLKGWFN